MHHCPVRQEENVILQDLKVMFDAHGAALDQNIPSSLAGPTPAGQEIVGNYIGHFCFLWWKLQGVSDICPVWDQWSGCTSVFVQVPWISRRRVIGMSVLSCHVLPCSLPRGVWSPLSTLCHEKIAQYEKAALHEPHPGGWRPFDAFHRLDYLVACISVLILCSFCSASAVQYTTLLLPLLSFFYQLKIS